MFGGFSDIGNAMKNGLGGGGGGGLSGAYQQAQQNAQRNALQAANPMGGNAAGGNGMVPLESRGKVYDRAGELGLLVNEREGTFADVPTELGGQHLTDAYGATQQMFDPYMQQGQQAFDMQSAMSGAMGPEAQQQAYANIQESPGQQFIRDRMRKGLMANAKLGGDFGSGNMGVEGGLSGRMALSLQEQAGGFAMQDVENQFNRLGQVAQPGMAFTGQLGGYRQGLGQGLAQERKDLYGASVADSMQRNEWNLGQQQVDLSNAAMAMDRKKVHEGAKAASSQRKSDMIGSVASGAGAIVGGISDRRLKENIIERGKGKNGLSLYEFTYKGNDDKFEGYMADEIMEIDPNHVFKGTDGFYRVSAEYAPVRI